MHPWHDIVKSPSKTFAVAAGSWCGGILIGVYATVFFLAPLPEAVLIGVAALGGAVAVAMTDRRARVAAVCLALAGSGALWGSTSVRAPVSPGVREVVGEIRSEPEMRAHGIRVMVDDVLVLLPLDEAVQYGDTVSFTCELEPPQPIETFRYDLHLSGRGVSAVCTAPHDVWVQPAKGNPIAVLLFAKEQITGRLRALVPEPHATFLAGVLFGGGDALPVELRDDFARTGTAHILAASGFNVSIFSLTLLGMLMEAPIGRRRAIVGAFILVALYVLIAGAGPAVVRAGLMAAALMLGKAIQRPPFAWNILLLAVAVMLAQNPLVLLDVGFQLSVAATAAIMLFAQPLSRLFAFLPSMFEIREAFAGSLAAAVITAPILVWHFGSISLLAPLVNLLVLPLIAPLLWLTVVLLVVSVFSVPVAMVVALIPWAASSFMLHVVHWYAAVPMVSVELARAQEVGALLAALLVFGLIVWAPRLVAARARS